MEDCAQSSCSDIIVQYFSHGIFCKKGESALVSSLQTLNFLQGEKLFHGPS